MSINEIFPELVPPIRYPGGYTKETLFDYLNDFRLNGVESAEFSNYLAQDLNRFVYTLNLLPGEEAGKTLLETGSNPYFTSILLKKFTQFDLFFSNFISIHFDQGSEFQLNVKTEEKFEFDFVNHNIEESDIPYQHQFDVVLFCEVLEHLIKDPLGALERIGKSIKRGGQLILTTPNVNRLENVAKMLGGSNIYDPYSGYGEYGRHNREYNKHELNQLLLHAGFEIEVMFSADVHENNADTFFPIADFSASLLKNPLRKYDLGQYIFIRARKVGECRAGKPRWLYRSYPESDLC